MCQTNGGLEVRGCELFSPPLAVIEDNSAPRPYPRLQKLRARNAWATSEGSRSFQRQDSTVHFPQPARLHVDSSWAKPCSAVHQGATDQHRMGVEGWLSARSRRCHQGVFARCAVRGRLLLKLCPSQESTLLHEHCQLLVKF